MRASSSDEEAHQPHGDDRGAEKNLQTTRTDTSPYSSDGSNSAAEDGQAAALSSQTCAEKWSQAVHTLQRPIKKVLMTMAHHAAVHPRLYVKCTVLIALVMAGVGLFTNFNIESREYALWTPTGSLPEQHGDWVDSVTFEGDPEDKFYHYFAFVVHANGGNVVDMAGMRRLFEVLDLVRSVPGYDEFCSEHGGTTSCPPIENSEWLCDIYGVPLDDRVCEIGSVTGFYFNNATIFETSVTSDETVQRNLAQEIIPSQGKKLDITNIVGYPEYDETGERMISALSFLSGIDFPRNDGYESEALKLELAALDAVLALRDEWAADEDNPYVLEVITTTSFEEEFTRGIVKDLPLMPLVGVVMTFFTCFVFWKRGDPLNSRCLLGFGAVGCIGLSIMTGYGLLFICGVPFTSLTQAIPFIVFGIGLDDSFVIYMAYIRTDCKKSPVERIDDTMDDISASIFMTTITSVFAFALGCISAAPAIRWMCLYAFVTIAIDFVYQVTFFIALVVLDEERIANRRKDCVICCKVEGPDLEEEDIESDHRDDETPEEKHVAERLMISVADTLLKPWVKGLVILVFTSFFGLCVWRTSKLKVDFDFTSVLPSDSYIIPFQYALNDYTERGGVSPYLYFRDVDQSQIEIHVQMENYVNTIANSEGVTGQPFGFWVRDYYNFVFENAEKTAGLSFYEIFPMFLEDPVYDPSGSFVLDADGHIVASRTQVHMSMDPSDIGFILDALTEQRQLTSEQPINQGGGDWSFFSYDVIFKIWEFLAISVAELKLTTIIGVATVSFMSMIFIPHWSGVLFVGPLIGVLYIDLLGFLQLCGVDINGVTYVVLVMSIGLLVDFVMHIALRYFESTEHGREAKAKEVLRTMGTPVFLAGMSTFLGVLPLSLASSSIIFTIVIAFLGMVGLGVTHGLIFLPVVLSIIGPEGTPRKPPSEDKAAPVKSPEQPVSSSEARTPQALPESPVFSIKSPPTPPPSARRKPDPPDAEFLFVDSSEWDRDQEKRRRVAERSTHRPTDESSVGNISGLSTDAADLKTDSEGYDTDN